MDKIKYVHTNIVSKDWKKLTKFYINALNCSPVHPERNMRGEWLDRLTNINEVHIEGIHLRLPGYKYGPTLEIFSYNKSLNRTKSNQINETGFAHIAFRVDNLEKYVDEVLKYGGQFYGEISHSEIKNIGHLSVVYMRDPEGNIVELQHWD